MTRDPEPLASNTNSLRSIYVALAANAAIAAAKLGAAVYTGSTSMLAEAIHSAADSANQALLLLGVQRARRPPSADHPLGYGKAIYFWSFVVALLLFSLGGMFSIYEGRHKLGSSEAIEAPWLAILILVFSLVMETLSLRTCLREVNKSRRGRTLWRWFRDSRQSELIVVFGEDLAALAGLSIALLALLLTVATGDPVFDAAGSIVIGVLLIVVAVGVAVEVKSLLIGESAEAEVKQAIHAFLSERAEVEQIFTLITLQLGADLMVAVKARMTEQGSVQGLIEAINRCEAELRKNFPAIRWIFFEPDDTDA
jgi:cation diffusion facilitator family transporter